MHKNITQAARVSSIIPASPISGVDHVDLFYVQFDAKCGVLPDGVLCRLKKISQEHSLIYSDRNLISSNKVNCKEIYLGVESSTSAILT